MFLVFRTYIVEKHNEGVDTNIINTKQYIKKSIDFLLNEKKQSYINSSHIIFSDDKILKALKSKDRENFYKSIEGFYNQLKKRDSDFWGLHIILPNNMSFIRVHKPHVVDRLIEKGKKPLIDKVNESHQQVTSFDAGKFGYFLRVVTPIFSKEKKYLGVAEFSVNVDSLTQHIKNQFGYESLFLVKNIHNKEFLNSLPRTKDGLYLYKSTNEYIFNHYELGSKENNNPHNLIAYENKNLSTVLIKLSDSATIIVAFDVTNMLNEQNTFEENITALVYFVILVFSIIWFTATQFYLKNKRRIDSQLKEFHGIISDNVIFSNTDISGKIIEVSDAFCRESGYSREQLIGSMHKITRHPDMESSTYEGLWETIKSNKIWKGEIKNLKNDGNFYWVSSTISPRFDRNNKKIGYTSIMHDISDRKMIEAISITDGLCGIYNRRHFDEVFKKIINSAKRKNELICFSILDLDYFKQYNDTYGHQMGDEVLKSVANSITESLNRADDCCFRLGGEEFGVVFKAEDKQLALNFINKIRINIEQLKIPHNGNSVSDYVTASFGVMCKNANEIKNADKAYKEADDLLYKAKKSGRNKVEINA